MSWSASTDNVAVTSYQVGLDSGAPNNVGNVLTCNITGLAAETVSSATPVGYNSAFLGGPSGVLGDVRVFDVALSDDQVGLL